MNIDLWQSPFADLKAKVDKNTAALVKWNMIAAFALLAAGGLFAFLVAMTRWPSVHLLPLVYFYRFLTLHGINALLAWIIFFEIALVHFTSAVLLGTRSHAPALGWLAFALMLIGGVLVNVIVLLGGGDVLFTSYVPLKADPLYYLGVIIFAVGALLGFILFFVNIVLSKREGGYKTTLPLGTFGLGAASIIGVFTLLHGAGIFIPTLLWSMNILPSINPSAYRLVFWGLGHASQQINVCAMVAVWYMTSAMVLGGKPLNEKLSRTAFIFYILFINVASEHHLLVDPVIGTWHKIANTGYVMHMAVLASMIHAFAIPASMEVALREQGHTRGLFEWLKKAPWGNPAFSGIVISILNFGFIGGITGVIFGTLQYNIIRHNTWAITGHFHGTVVAGTTVAFMGFSYLLVPYIFRRRIIWKGLAQIQPYLYGIAIGLQSIFMMSSGIFGIPRRHYDVTFSGATFPFTFDPTAFLFLSAFAITAILAVLGGLLFILIMFGSILFGERIEG